MASVQFVTRYNINYGKRKRMLANWRIKTFSATLKLEHEISDVSLSSKKLNNYLTDTTTLLLSLIPFPGPSQKFIVRPTVNKVCPGRPLDSVWHVGSIANGIIRCLFQVFVFCFNITSVNQETKLHFLKPDT